ncbi:PaxB protein [Purpureocillium lilacinum]|uniref:PaxB protein n=1 Tax=Purpureocillium lilacinum TaxID=33203 RepID=A0A179HRR4_PURLI|nr:PaxB protein [Purpureocillium lilacinum]OAQ92130.1 PaxB protein [Purpureocillium lilacinum]
MGSSDIPPPSAPTWLVPASTVLLGSGIVCWLACYVLMTRRSLATHATPIPLVPLGINLAWEVVYALYVTEAPLELAGFAMWLAFDVPVLYATLKTAPRSFASAPLVARNAGKLLAVVFVFGLASNALFAWWWLAEPHRGHGLKWGKVWNGLEARDTTELAWWSAGVAQMAMSVGALAMLIQRGHSGGQSYAIWLCRFAGTQLGLPGTCFLLWWYWPEAHGFVWHPLSIIIVGTSMACDVAYPFVLAHVRKTERVLPDGTVVAGDVDVAVADRNGARHKKRN